MPTPPNQNPYVSDVVATQLLGRIPDHPLTIESADAIRTAQQILDLALAEVKNLVQSQIGGCNPILAECQNAVRQQLDFIVNEAYNSYSSFGQIIRDNLVYLMSAAQQYAAQLGYTGATLSYPTWPTQQQLTERARTKINEPSTDKLQQLQPGSQIVIPRSQDPTLQSSFENNPRYYPQTVNVTTNPIGATTNLIGSQGTPSTVPGQQLMGTPGGVLAVGGGVVQGIPTPAQTGLSIQQFSNQQPLGVTPTGVPSAAVSPVGTTVGLPTPTQLIPTQPTSAGAIAAGIAAGGIPVIAAPAVPITGGPAQGIVTTPQQVTLAPQLAPQLPQAALAPGGPLPNPVSPQQQQYNQILNDLATNYGIQPSGRIIAEPAAQNDPASVETGDLIEHSDGTQYMAVPCNVPNAKPFSKVASSIGANSNTVNFLCEVGPVAEIGLVAPVQPVNVCPIDRIDQTGWTPWEIANCQPAPPVITPTIPTQQTTGTGTQCCPIIDVASLCQCISQALTSVPPVPVDLDQSNAFLFSPDDVAWKRAALLFNGPWLQRLNAANSLDDYTKVALSNFPGADESSD